MSTDRLSKQLEFVLEADKLKNVDRRGYVLDKSRRENSAEHSWHLALMALLLGEHANAAVDIGHVIKLALVHDLVEIDAGDTYIYDTDAQHDKAAREAQAAERIFGLLPHDQATKLRALWDEFEAQETPESRFANALDRLQPIMLNYYAGGMAWSENSITREQVHARTEHSARGSETLWGYMRTLIDAAVQKGYLRP